MRCMSEIVQVDEDRVFVIDLYSDAAPCMTITNDAEALRDFMNEQYPGKRLIYRDTMGCWDEIVSDVEGLFKPYNEYLPKGYEWHVA